MSNRLTYIIATSLLVFVFFIAFLSTRDDSLTSDELVHLPAGYSYLTQKDMRLNPEHPPLIKDFVQLITKSQLTLNRSLICSLVYFF
ncbi:hypothetical protein KKH59_03900 [Patescibacteria group bacterium]|nr:hypothetical protein [Patescibacteria group bacterium]